MLITTHSSKCGSTGTPSGGESTKRQLERIREAIKLLLSLKIHEESGYYYIVGVFREIANDEDRWYEFVAKQLRGLIYELAAIYTFVSKGFVAHPFTFAERTIGKIRMLVSGKQERKFYLGDFMVLCAPEDHEWGEVHAPNCRG